jgi:hypothetical protein
MTNDNRSYTSQTPQWRGCLGGLFRTDCVILNNKKG